MALRLPPLIVAAVAILLIIFVQNTPEEAGYHGLIEEAGGGDTSSRTTIRESFTTIFTHPLIWFYAVAYGCTGAVRNSSDQLMVLYFHDQLKLNLADKPAAVLWTVNLMPLVAIIGSFSAGVISDKFFQGHRSPVAMTLYFVESAVILTAAFVIASGVVDSFQYYGTALALSITGWMIDRHGWGVWYPIMASFGAIGGFSMLMVMRKQRRLHAAGDARATSR